MPRLKGSADLLEDRRRRALALLDDGFSLNQAERISAGAIIDHGSPQELDSVVGWNHVERRFPARGGGHPIDGYDACAAWNLSAADPQVRAQLLRTRNRVRQHRADELLHRPHAHAGRRHCTNPSRSGPDGRCARVCRFYWDLFPECIFGLGFHPSTVSAFGDFRLENLAFRLRRGLPWRAFLRLGVVLPPFAVELKSETYLCSCAVGSGAIDCLSGTSGVSH